MSFPVPRPERASPPAASARPVASQTLIGFAGTGAALLLGFATKVLLTRTMSAGELGIVLAAQALTNLALVVAELGLPDAVVRYVGLGASADAAPKRTVRTALRLAAWSSAIASLVVIGTLLLWPGRPMSSGALWATVILTLSLPLLAAGDVLGAAYRGINRIGTKLLMVDVARPGIVAAALLLSPLVLAGRAPYVAGLYLLGALGALAALWVRFTRDPRWQDTGVDTPSELLRFGLPVAGATVLAGPLVNGLLPTMLSAWTGTTAVAYYGIALALQSVAALPQGILEQVLVPWWARGTAQTARADLGRSFQRYTNISFASTAGLAILLIANDRAILSWTFGPAYAEAGGALRGVVIATLFAAWTGPNEAMLRAVGLTRPIFAARLLTAAAGTACAALLIPRWGLSGAVIAFAAAVAVLNVAYGAALHRATGMHPFSARHAVTTAAVLAAVVSAWTLRGTYPLGGWVAAHALAVAIVAANVDVRSALRALPGWGGGSGS